MNAPVSAAGQRPSNFLYAPMFPLGPDNTPWKKLDIAGVRTSTCDGQTVLRIAPDALSELAVQAFHDVSHLLRPAHLASLRAILDDPEASANDRFVALDLLKNANIAAGGVLPMCQDTGTAIVVGKKGQRVWVDGDEEEALAWGVHRTYTETNLRYSQMAPLSMFNEVNTGNNLPVQFDIYANPGDHHADPRQHGVHGGSTACEHMATWQYIMVDQCAVQHMSAWQYILVHSQLTHVVRVRSSPHSPQGIPPPSHPSLSYPTLTVVR